jgi:hypothetical protein
MKENRLTITIKKPLDEVFVFATQAPNTKYWIPGVIDEAIDTEFVAVGTRHTLTTSDGRSFVVVVAAYKENEYIEWTDEVKIFYCRHEYSTTQQGFTKLDYIEWMEFGELKEPFEQTTMDKLKGVLEA